MPPATRLVLLAVMLPVLGTPVVGRATPGAPHGCWELTLTTSPVMYVE
jgi:hypothetical protein